MKKGFLITCLMFTLLFASAQTKQIEFVKLVLIYTNEAETVLKAQSKTKRQLKLDQEEISNLSNGIVDTYAKNEVSYEQGIDSLKKSLLLKFPLLGETYKENVSRKIAVELAKLEEQQVKN